MHRILVVDDEVAIRKALEKFLLELGFQVESAADGESGLEILKRQSVDLCLVDLVMPKVDGIEFIRQAKIIDPNIVAIVMTGFGTITSAVEAMKAGAYHYLTKPFELDDIAALLNTSLEHKQLKTENQELRKQLKSKYRFENIVGNSEEMHEVFSLVSKVADTDSTILILGESGTGKELIAKAVHYNSRRREKPLVTVNCSAIPEELLESELFGHVKGAFTGAVTTKAGRFDTAHTGTIFLDEIGDMSLKLQVKLLRVLQERKFEPVGSTQTHEVDVRIVAATNQHLERAVKEGRFREDLYYRLNVIPIHIPPLRERTADIPLLLQHFLNLYNKENGRELSGFRADALQTLIHYPWPGNVRELENLVERLVVLRTEGEIVLEDLPEKLRDQQISDSKGGESEIPDTGISFKQAISNFENTLILRALEKTGWNKNKAATLLKLNRTTLVEKIKKKGLEDKITE